MQARPADELLRLTRAPDDVVTVRGRIQPLPTSSTEMNCGDEPCCNYVGYRFGLIGASGRRIDLEGWREAPAFEKDCDPRAARWLSTLTVAVTGVLASGSSATLVAKETCRLP